MNRKLLFIIFAAFISGFTIFPVNPENAGIPTETSRPATAQIETLTFSNLGYTSPIILNGPYQKTSAVFSLPPDWQINGDLQMELEMQVEFQSLMEAFASDDLKYQPATQGGILQIKINGQLGAQTVIRESGEQTLAYTLAADLLKEDLEDNEISISWDTATACQYDVTSFISIDAASWISIPIQYKTSAMTLTNFPKPFYESTAIQTYPTAIILPENPDESELTALMAVSAGLGKHSAGRLVYDILSADEADRMDLKDYHLILIGLKNDIVDVLGENAADFEQAATIASEEQDTGLVWYGLSPRNSGRTLMVITGENDQALVKASAVIASDDWVPFSDENLAAISDISAAMAVEDQLKVDYVLGEINAGSNSMHIEELGVTTVKIPFQIPGDVQVTPESYLELYFRHSQMLNYLRSGLSVSINGRKIGTIRFSDNSAENGLARIILPPNIIHPHNNELEITFTLTGQDICADQRSGDYWITIFNESYLHLPPDLTVDAKIRGTNFNNTPWAFLQDESMSDLIFTAAEKNLDAWRYAADLAFTFGSFTNAGILAPSAMTMETYLENPTNGSAILVGMIDEIPAGAAINSLLPVPFSGTAVIDTLTVNGTQFNVDKEDNFGILEIGFDRESGQNVLFILGNTEKGLERAVGSMREIFYSENKPSSNVRIIDQQEHIYDFQVEQAYTDEGAKSAPSGGWLAQLMAVNVNQAAFYLLGVVGLITIIFVSWTIATNRKQRKNRK